MYKILLNGFKIAILGFFLFIVSISLYTIYADKSVELEEVLYKNKYFVGLLEEYNINSSKINKVNSINEVDTLVSFENDSIAGLLIYIDEISDVIIPDVTFRTDENALKIRKGRVYNHFTYARNPQIKISYDFERPTIKNSFIFFEFKPGDIFKQTTEVLNNKKVEKIIFNNGFKIKSQNNDMICKFSVLKRSELVILHHRNSLRLIILQKRTYESGYKENNYLKLEKVEQF